MSICEVWLNGSRAAFPTPATEATRQPPAAGPQAGPSSYRPGPDCDQGITCALTPSGLTLAAAWSLPGLRAVSVAVLVWTPIRPVGSVA